jgi:hypothetical protein
VLSALWLARAGSGITRLEASANVLALGAAIIGIPAERWASARERRDRALRTLAEEMTRNEPLLDTLISVDGGPAARHVYPRLLLSAADLAVTSGALGADRDHDLLERILRWRDAVHELNRRLDLTELRMFAGTTISDRELRGLQVALHRPGGLLSEVSGQYAELRRALAAAAADDRFGPVRLRRRRRTAGSGRPA